jgi:hypothetical protein
MLKKVDMSMRTGFAWLAMEPVADSFDGSREDEKFDYLLYVVRFRDHKIIFRRLKYPSYFQHVS